MSTNEYDSPSENPYAAPAPIPMEAEPIPGESDEARLLRAFVGRKADYYFKKWAPLLAGSGRGAGFNWAAFFLCGLWLPYRKMYWFSAIFYTIIVTESLAEEVLFVVVLGEPEPPAVLSNVIGIAVAVLCGAYGNQWYLSHARKVIRDVRARGFEEHGVLEMLSARGGTSLLASLGFFFLFLVVTFGIYTVLDLMLYPA